VLAGGEIRLTLKELSVSVEWSTVVRRIERSEMPSADAVSVNANVREIDQVHGPSVHRLAAESVAIASALRTIWLIGAKSPAEDFLAPS
jgi:hypothetical protein